MCFFRHKMLNFHTKSTAKVILFLDMCKFFCTFAAKFNVLIMKNTLLLIACVLIGALTYTHAQETTHQRFVGGDISMLPKYEQYNSPYLDPNGREISNLLTWFIEKCKWNTFRVRIFVNPGTSDPSVCQTTEYVAALGKRIKDAGAFFMLDFHYSDTWVDATHIQAPAAWQGKSASVMADSISAYTHRTLQTLKAAGATPDLVQVGNEIMCGLCGIKVTPYSNSSTDANWPNYINLLKAGCNAVRQECPQAQIIIHTDRPNEVTNTKYYYKKLVDANLDFDVIGLSYYPFWHGYLTPEQNTVNLVTSINRLATDFPSKRVQIVECAYNFQYWPSSGVHYNTQSIWPCSVVGQYNFVRDLVDALQPLENVDGISYWFPEEAGNGDTGSVIPSWLNRGFWSEDKSTSGHTINMTKSSAVGQTLKNICAPYYMANFLTSPTQGIEETAETQNKNNSAIKVLKDGKLFILRCDQTYTPSGALINH